LDSQLFWGFVGLVLAAVAMSGKLSMEASALLLAVAWVLGCIGLYRIEAIRDWYTMTALWFSLGAALAFLGASLQPSVPTINRPTTVTSSSTVHREQRETLACLFERGSQLHDKYISPDDISHDPAIQWLEEVSTYLEHTFGHSYVTQWKSDEGFYASYLLDSNVSKQNERSYVYLSNRLAQLRKIMERL
jgi:hypothetical protein